MNDLFAALLNGIIFGSGYALLALGIVLIYKGSRVFNFAQGEFGTVAAFVLYLLQFHVPYWVAIVGALVAAVAMGLLMERLVIQPLFNAPKVTLLVATVAVALGAISLELFFVGGGSTRFLPVAVEGTAFTAFLVAVTWQKLLVVAALGALAAALALFFTKTQLGLAVLAASQEPTATNLVGISVRRISSLVWALAAFLGGLAGILLSPGFGEFTPAYVTSNFLIFAFVAAVVGGMTSLPGAVVGGLALGIVQQLTLTYLTKIDWVSQNIASTGDVAVFVLLLAVLLIRPAGLLGKET